MVDRFYINVGCILVVLNFFKFIFQFYLFELMREYYVVFQFQKLKFYVFMVGEQIYRNVKSLIELVNQFIVVSGESGVGKIWMFCCLMKFYVVVVILFVFWEIYKIVERIEQRILNFNFVMEVFGNVCILRNNNSSCFGKFIQFQLNRVQQMIGVVVQIYFLEKI